MATSAKLKPLLRSARQIQYRAATEQIAGFVGGRGSGKTRIGAEDVVLRARKGESWMSVSPSYPIIHETTLPTVVEVCETLGVLRRVVKSPVPRVLFRTQDGGVADLVFRTGEAPEKLRGPSKAGLWFDEASIMHEDCFKLGLPVLRHKGVMGPCRMTFTPKGRQHWTFNVFFERVDESQGYFRDQGGKLFFCQTQQDTGQLTTRLVHSFSGVNYVQRPGTRLVQSHTLENPFLPPQFFDVIRGQYSSLLAQQELAGDFVDIQGLMFRREWFRAVDYAPKDCSRVRYWDRAATADGGDFSAGVLMARDNQGRYYIEDVVRGQWSYHARDEVIQQTAQRDAQQFANKVVIYIEQEGGSGGKEAAEQAVIKLAGYPVYVDVVSGARKRVKDKIQLPGEGKVVRAMPMAAQAEAGNVFYLRDALWVEDLFEELCVDAKTRIRTNTGCKVVCEISHKDLVLTRLGYRRVRVCRKTRDNAVIGELAAGPHRLRCTANHPVYVVGKGFVRADHVLAGDVLACYSTAHGITAIQTRNRRQSETTFRDITTVKTTNFIERFTRNFMENWIAVGMCTISMATHGIIDQRIYGQPKTRGILSNILHEGMCHGLLYGQIAVSSAIESIKRLKQVEAKRAASDAALLPVGVLVKGLLGTTTCAKSAARSIARTIGNLSSAGRPVSDNLTDGRGETQHVHVSYAEQSSGREEALLNVVLSPVRTPWRGVSVGPVWNLEVDGQHEYFADDILVHNCGFPETPHDDQVDACSGAFNKLAGSAGFYTTSIQRVEVQASHVASSKYGVKLNESKTRRFRFGKED